MHYPLSHLTNDELVRHADSTHGHDALVQLLCERLVDLMRAADKFIDAVDDIEHDNLIASDEVALRKAITGANNPTTTG